MKLRIKAMGLTVAVTAVLTACGGEGGYTGTLNGSKTPVVSSPAPIQSASFSKTGTGDTVFDLPSSVTRIQIQATYNGNSSNFIVHIAGNLIVNELLGSSYKSVNSDGTYLLIGGGTVEVTNSSGVLWTFTAI